MTKGKTDKQTDRLKNRQILQIDRLTARLNCLTECLSRAEKCYCVNVFGKQVSMEEDFINFDPETCTGLQ